MPLSDADALTMAENLVALLEKGDALAAAVAHEHHIGHGVLPFDACTTHVCEAARAWREARG